MNKRDSLRIPAIILMIIVIALLIPFIYVSKFAYPWADDFSYSADARIAFVQTGNIFKAIGAAARTTFNTYFDWQGTYTSCFLMALQPAVWGVKLYHLTGSVMLGTLFLGYFVLFYAIFNRIFKAGMPATLLLFGLTYLMTIETTGDKADAFTWWNSAVHYTYNHAFFVLFVGLLSLFLYMVSTGPSGKNRTIWMVLLSLLGFLVAGGNNVTVFAGLLFLVLLELFMLFCIRWGVAYSLPISLLPIIIAYTIGSLINFLAPGNQKRLAITSNGSGHGFFRSIIHAFAAGGAHIAMRYSWLLFAFMILTSLILWHVLVKRRALDNISFRFSLPGFVLLISYCFLSALYTPEIYSESAEVPLESIILNINTAGRVHNVIFYMYLLLILLNEVYFIGWIYKRLAGAHKRLFSLNGQNPDSDTSAKKSRFAFLIKGFSVIEIGIACIAVLICIITCFLHIKEYPSTYLTSSAVANLTSGSAQYYGWQMAENTRRLMEDGSDVLVMPIAVDPDCLYPHDAADWKEGVKLFYDKESVTYESDPYNF